jgi:hypothetical protein
MRARTSTMHARTQSTALHLALGGLATHTQAGTLAPKLSDPYKEAEYVRDGRRTQVHMHTQALKLLGAISPDC